MPSQFVRPISPMDSRAFGLHSRICRGRSQAFTPAHGRTDVSIKRGLLARRRAGGPRGERRPIPRLTASKCHISHGERTMSFIATEKPVGVPAPITAGAEDARARGREIPSSDRQEAVSVRIGSVIGRIALHSTDEIERLIAELQSFRNFLETESQRVQREVSAYVRLSEAAAKSSNVIIESIG